MKRSLLIVGLMVVVVALFFVAVYLAVPEADVPRAKNAAGIVQASVTALVIVIGVVIAAYKLDAFRDFEPHLTITHEVTHRPIGDNYVHIAVTATLYNSSKVMVEVVEAFSACSRFPLSWMKRLRTFTPRFS